MNITSIPVEQQYYFNAIIDKPLSLELQTLREKSAYDADFSPESTAIKLIEKLSNQLEGNLYLIVVGNDIAPSNRLRSKKGALWGENELRKLDSRNFEVFVDDNNTRLVSLVDLSSFSYESPSKVLNWLSSMLVLSNIDLDELTGLTDNWLSKDRKSVLPYNYDAIANTLYNQESTAVLRYFPADNGKPESLVAVGQKSFLEAGVVSCIKNLI